VMIKKGELYNVEEDTLAAIYTKAKYQSEKDARLNQKSAKQNRVAEAEKIDNSRLDGEESSKMNGYHGRDATSGALANANDEWKKRISKGNINLETTQRKHMCA
jgi:hypothetical protein